MRIIKNFQVLPFFLFLLSVSTLLLFQNCGPQNFDTLGNGDPYEGLDTTDGVSPTIPVGGGGSIVDPSTGDGSPGSGGSPGTGGGSGGGGGGSPGAGAPPANIPAPNASRSPDYDYIYICPTNNHIKMIAYAEHRNGNFYLLLKAKDGIMKRFKWKPNKDKIEVFKNLSKKVFVQTVFFNENKRQLKLFYLVKGSQSLKKHQVICDSH